MTEDRPTFDDVTQTLTGFDQIAIAKRWSPVDKLADSDPMMFPRALVFVLERRDGASDQDAYRSAMQAPLSQVLDRFATESAAQVSELDPDEVGRLDAEWAQFVVTTQLAFTPDEWRSLTISQRSMLAEALRRG